LRLVSVYYYGNYFELTLIVLTIRSLIFLREERLAIKKLAASTSELDDVSEH
jgi:hypothetical protein